MESSVHLSVFGVWRPCVRVVITMGKSHGNARSPLLRGKQRPPALLRLWLALLVAGSLVSNAYLTWLAQSGMTTGASVASLEGEVPPPDDGVQARARVLKATPMVAPQQSSPYHEDARRAHNFTVVISTHGDSLYNPCVIRQWLPLRDVVSSIIVVWDDPDEHSYELVTRAVSADFAIPTEFVSNGTRTASLNNRYLIHGRVRTAAVFAVDDDIRIRHIGVRAAFDEWRRHPDLLINYSLKEVVCRGGENGTGTLSSDGLRTDCHYKGKWPGNWHESSTLGLTMAGERCFRRRRALPVLFLL